VEATDGAATSRFVSGDVNQRIEYVLMEIPSPGKGQNVLTFCFADPYAMSNLRFSTIERLSELYVDFLILIPTGMDATRWWAHHLRPENRRVEDFLGLPTWRDEWRRQQRRGVSVDIFLTSQYHERMRALRYAYGGVAATVDIRIPGRNVRLYRLGFFSRHPLGERFWKEARRRTTPQTDLFGGPED
jgi:three-Cys-motif partner protein